jgi:hypothetical protein
LAGLALALVATAGCGKSGDETPAVQVNRHIATLKGDGWFIGSADQVAAAQALGELAQSVGAAELKAATAALFKATSGSAEIKGAAEVAFFRTGSAGVSFLIESLGDTDPEVRLKALTLIDRWGQAAAPAVPAVIRFVSDAKRQHAPEDLTLAQRVVEKLGTGAPHEARSLLDIFKRSDKVGRWATTVLARWGAFEPGRLPEWRNGATDSSPEMRVHALQVLGMPAYGFASNRDIFVNAFKDEVVDVAIAAARIVVANEPTAPELGEMLERYSRPNHKRQSNWRPWVDGLSRDIAPQMGPKAIPFLVSWMNAGEGFDMTAMQALASMKEGKTAAFAAIVDHIEKRRPKFTWSHYRCLEAVGEDERKNLPAYTKRGYDYYAAQDAARRADRQQQAAWKAANKIKMPGSESEMDTFEKKLRESIKEREKSSSPQIPPGAVTQMVRKAVLAAIRILR